MQKTSRETKRRLGAKMLPLLLAVLIFFPILGGAQQIEISVSAEIKGPVAPTPTSSSPFPGAGGGGVYVPLETKLILKGRAYPLAIITILKNNTVIANFKAEQSGLFEREIKGIAGGIYDFSIFAEDTEGKKSVTLSFPVTILENRITTVSGIFIPSTISLAPSLVAKGEKINIFGQVFPEAKVRIFIFPLDLIEEVSATKEGNWFFELDTGSLEMGEYKVKTKDFFGEGEQSEFSEEMPFLVALICKGADLNFDGKIDVFDFSILLHWWETNLRPRPCADINLDNIVDVVDLSIMMHYWTD